MDDGPLMSLGQVEVKSAQDGTQCSQTHTALCLPVGTVPSEIAKKLELPTVMVYTCQKSLATHHQLLAHMTLKT